MLLLASEEGRYINGIDILCDGGMHLSYTPLTLTAKENRIRIDGPQGFMLQLRRGSNDHLPTILANTDTELSLIYNGTPYKVRLISGTFAAADHIDSFDGIIEAEIFDNIH